jgi:hypothetical protein
LASPSSADEYGSVRRSAAPMQILSILVWLSAGIIAVLLGADGSAAGAERATLTISILSIALGVWLFWVHGGTRITAVGAWGFAFALFVGVAGWFTVVVVHQPPPNLLQALVVAYFGQVAMYGLFWRWSAQPAAAIRWPVDPLVARWGIGVGSVLLLGSSLASLLGAREVVLVDETAFASAVLLAASLLLHRGSGLGIFRLALTAGAFLAYALFVFSGFGRLTLGALGLAIGIVATKWFPGRTVKGAILLMSVPTLVILSQTRVAFTAQLNPDQGSITGFESATSPLITFARLLEMHAQTPLAWGSTFWASAVALVPHSIWPNKPPGFGAVLVPIFDPELVGTGHSEAALSHGEWLYNFGPIGLVLMVLVLGPIVRVIDRWLESTESGPVWDRPRLLSYVGAAIAAAGLVDLVWVGTFTWVARSGSRLLIIGLLALLSWIVSPTRKHGPRVHSPPRAAALVDG